MNQRQLEYFLEVYKHKSLKKAAEYLMISPQGLSKIIKTLEDEVHLKLFQRTKYSYEPTKDAELLYPHATTIIEEYKKIENHNGMFRRKVNIYTIDGIFDYFVLDFMKDFYKEHEGIAMKILETSNQEAIQHVRNRDGELAILQNKCDLSDFKNIFLFECPFCFVINKKNPLSKLKQISLIHDASKLDGVAIAGRGFEYVLYDRLIKILAHFDSHPISVMESNNEQLLLSLAEENIAIACVSKKIAEKNSSPNTCICEIVEQDVYDRIYLAYKSNSPLSPEAREFKDYLIKWTKNKLNG